MRGKAQFCPLTVPMVLLAAIVSGVVFFSGAIAVGAAWFLLWLGASLAVGRGWCGWGCFFGGWDELFSRSRWRPAPGRPAYFFRAGVVEVEGVFDFGDRLAVLVRLRNPRR